MRVGGVVVYADSSTIQLHVGKNVQRTVWHVQCGETQTRRVGRKPHVSNAFAMVSRCLVQKIDRTCGGIQSFEKLASLKALHEAHESTPATKNGGFEFNVSVLV